MYSVFFNVSFELITTNSLTLEPYIFNVFTTVYHTRLNDATNFQIYYLTKHNNNHSDTHCIAHNKIFT